MSSLPFSVAFDGEKLLSSHPTGVERYVVELLRAFGRLNTELPELFVVTPRANRLPAAIPPAAHHIEARSAKRYGELWWPLAVKRIRPSVTFEPARPLPYFLNLPRPIITIHDLAFLHFPDHYHPREAAITDFRIRHSLAKAEHVLAVSEATKQDLIEHYSLPGDKITAVPLGVDHATYRPDSPLSEAAVQKVKAWQPFFLFIGRLEKRKNVLGLLEAYRLLLHEQDIAHNLVLLGNPGYGYDEIEAAVKAFGVQKNRVIQPGYVTDDVKSAALRMAEALVCPSFYEGSSLPILEAQASGLPVITSERGATAEVAGTGALLVDPDKPLETAGAMSRLLKTPELRDNLIRKGLKNAAGFTWEKTAEGTLNAWMEVAR